jgi:hypothetical protein
MGALLEVLLPRHKFISEFCAINTKATVSCRNLINCAYLKDGTAFCRSGKFGPTRNFWKVAQRCRSSVSDIAIIFKNSEGLLYVLKN